MSTSGVTYTAVTEELANNYIDNLNQAKNKINSYCAKDKNIAKFIELLYGIDKFEYNSIDYYMAVGIHKIIDSTSIIKMFRFLENNNDFARYYNCNVLENVIDLIEHYFHIDSSEENCDGTVFGFSFKIIKRNYGIDIAVVEEEFTNENEMKNNGFTNNCKDIIDIVEEYAHICYENNYNH